MTPDAVYGGAAHVPAFTYLVGSAISSIVWSVVFTEVGYLFGDAAVMALRRMERYDEYVIAVVAGVAVVGWLIYRQRRAKQGDASATSSSTR